MYGFPLFLIRILFFLNVIYPFPAFISYYLFIILTVWLSYDCVCLFYLTAMYFFILGIGIF